MDIVPQLDHVAVPVAPGKMGSAAMFFLLCLGWHEYRHRRVRTEDGDEFRHFHHPTGGVSVQLSDEPREGLTKPVPVFHLCLVVPDPEGYVEQLEKWAAEHQVEIVVNRYGGIPFITYPDLLLVELEIKAAMAPVIVGTFGEVRMRPATD